MIFLLVIAVLYYLIILWTITGLIFSKKTVSPADPPATRVSVVIPARNEEADILMLLEDLLLQDYPRHLSELILVDDHSEDDTFRIAAGFKDLHQEFNVTILHREGAPSKKEALREGINASSGELILTSDADCRLPASWVSSMAKCYESSGCRIILGPVAFMNEKNIFQKLQSLEFMGLMGATAGSASGGYPLMCNGASLAFSKSAFFECGGYEGNEKYASGDDQFLMMKMRKRYGKRAITFNFDKYSLVRTSPSPGFRSFIHQRLRWVSKNKGYRDFFITGVAVITYLFNLALLTGFFFPGLFTATLVFFFIKIILDFIPTARMANLFGKEKQLLLFPVASLLNIFYVVFIGIAGMVVPYRWKGITRRS